MAVPVKPDIIAIPEDEPIVLTGAPGLLTGQVDLQNRSDTDVVLRDASVTDPKGVLTSRPLRQSIPTVVLRAHQERRVVLTLAVAPATPPGEYHAALELGGVSLPALIHVAEVFDLTVAPKSIVLLNRSVEATQKRIIVTNEGNVAFSIGDIGEVDLEDDMLSDQAARLALEPWIENANRKTEGPVLVLLRLGRKGAYREAGLLVRTLGKKVKVPPGDTKLIDLEITLQTELPQNSRYRGRVPLLTADLEFVVVSSGGRVAGAPAVKPALSAGKSAKGGPSGTSITKGKGGGG